MSTIAPILKAIRAALSNNTEANIQALADVAGLTIKKEAPNKIETVKHTTKKGKVIRGVVRTDLSYSEAKAIDEYTFKKDGGWFIREKHLSNVEPVVAGNDAPPTDTQAQATVIESVQTDSIVNDDDNNIEGLTRKFKPAAKKYKNPQIKLEPKEGAKLLKQTLTKLFPNTKFKVNMSRGTAYGSVSVSWVDGASYNLVDVIAQHFKGSGFDGMSDSSYYLNAINEDGKVVDYGLGYVSISRGYSREFLERLKDAQTLNMDNVTVESEGGQAWFNVTGKEDDFVSAVLSKAKLKNSTGKYHYGAIPQAANDEDAQDKQQTNEQPQSSQAPSLMQDYKVTPSVEPVEPEQPTKDTLKKQALKLDDVLVEWKPRFRWSVPPAYQRLDAKMLDKVFHVRGDISMLRMTAGISINGQEPPKYAVEHLQKVEAAKKAGYEMQKVQIKSDTGVIFVKNGMVLTNDGADKLLLVDSSVYDKPEIPNKAGYVPIITARVNIAKSFVKWLQTFGDSDDLATITKRLKETGFFDKFKIARADNDQSSLELRYREDVKTVPAGGAAYTAKISKRGDWPDLKKYIYQLAGVNLADYDDNGDSKIKGQKGLWFVINDFNEGENNVPSTSRALESDSDNAITVNQKLSAENSNANESSELGRLARPSINGLDARGGSERDGSIGLSEDDGISVGTGSDTIVSDGAGQRGIGASNTATKGSRSSRTNEPRTPTDRSRDSAVVRTYTRAGSVTQTAKEAEQLKAEGTPTQWGDVANIDKALPYLLPEQRDDVAKLEKRLIEENKNGMLFTNGTGTGKTFTGLGAVKRFANAGKKNILIVSMNDKIIRDFIKSAKALNLDIHQLDGISDNGEDKIVATTYANLAQNLTLGLRDWDLIVVDEAHNLMQGEKGEDTNALSKLRALSGHHAGFNEWVKMRHADKDPKPVGESPETGNPIYNQDELIEWEKFKKPLREQWQKTWSEQPKGRTKVVFLTATPFSYVKTLDWAEGYLFDFVPPAEKFTNKTDAMGAAYNSGSPYERFYMSNFGYKMRTNRLTRPDARVDVGILERKFAEKLKTEGAMSGRELSVPFDYDRKFVLVNSKIGEKIDEGFDYLWNTKDKDGNQKYGDLLRVINKRFDYLARLQLLEAIKAEEAIDQIKKHLALGRKVIVFHDFNEGGTTNPFVVKGGLSADDATSVESQYSEFKKERPDLINLELDIPAPIVTLRKAFPNALLFNGRVAKGQRIKNADLFNSDDSGNNVLIAQSDAGATGISFHDTTGKFQRVIINIGMPTKPAKLRQTEGRIYRVGQASNAIQRYLTTGTNWERSAFAQKIAERAETVDNLSQGESAVVSIKDALVRAYEEAEYFEPSENDGIGGKAYDEENARINKLTPFERAKTDYWVKQKVTAKRGDREGKEWYATPEPVGLFMVNLSGAHSGDDILEPSAGDGAIGRYMPSDASVTFIEPTDSLASRARMNNTNANVIVDNFENHESINKYDAIVMNPPFGNGGSIAIKHLLKAFEHLREGGRVVALLPVGKMDELIAKYNRDGYFENIYTVAEFTLPSSTFENAGTAVNTKIHVFEKHEKKSDAPQGMIKKDLSHYDDIEDLFNAIENINIKPRKPRLDEALAEYGIEVYPNRSKYIVTGEGLQRKDIVRALFSTFEEPNADGDYVQKYNRSKLYLQNLKRDNIPTMAQFNQGLSANGLPIKYQQKTNKYNTWDGVGDMPDWLRGAMRYGGKLEDFAVDKPVYDAVDDLEAERQKAKMIIESIPKTLDKLRLLDESPKVLEVIKLYEKNLNDLTNAKTEEDYQNAFDIRQIATKESNALIGGKPNAFFEELRAKKSLSNELKNTQLAKPSAKDIISFIRETLNNPSVGNLQKLASLSGLGLIVKKEKTLNQQQIANYIEKAFEIDTVSADYALMQELKSIGFDQEDRFKALDKAHKFFNEEKQKRELQAKKEAAKARKIANAGKPKIKDVVVSLLENTRLLKGREYEFLVSIQNKRVLSIKQRDWLEAIARRAGINIDGQIDIKSAQKKGFNSPVMSFQDWAEEYLDQDIYLMGKEQREENQKAYNEWLNGVNKYDDIGGFNFTPAIDLDQTLKSIKETLANGNHDNIKRLATLAGLTLKEPEPDIDLDMFGEPINQDFDLFGDPIQDGEESPVEELPRLAVVELPLNKLTLSEDVPQFKSGADGESGVVEALGGKFDRTGVAPIQVWERLDGRLEIISGRHRTDLARRSGEKTIPAQVHKESEGFTAKQAMMLDAELNIRDGQGKVKDYVDYFTHSEISEDEAERRGLIARSIGQRAFIIASKGSEELKNQHRNEIISDQAAAEISSIAPNNSAMQAVGLRVLNEHKPLNNALNTIKAVMALTREKGQEPDTFDLFGFDDSALKEAEAMARIASRKQRQIAEQLNAIRGAVKNPKLAAKHGVLVENEADALAKVQAMTAQKARWDNWSSHADLLAEVRKELNDKLDSLDFEDDDYYWLCQEELAA